ncbi:hypothetical protein RRG08_041406 [Elysia crispata]|uniref:Uncharacterized protein n=1 Tax=Elysia crispata TaxID=231223 RepID=A0AAE0XS75_9GAST|nr:hypothetical protein RRG08_041406 [Elysia crispata]
MENSRLWFNTVSADLRSANTHDEKLGQDEDDLLQVKKLRLIHISETSLDKTSTDEAMMRREICGQAWSMITRPVQHPTLNTRLGARLYTFEGVGWCESRGDSHLGRPSPTLSVHRLRIVERLLDIEELFPEATGRTPLTENQPRCFASRACKPRSYREAPPTKKPVNTSPGQRVDGRPKPASIMTVQQKGGRISQGLKGDPFRGDISATLSPTERRTPSHEVPQSKPHRGRCGANRGRGSTATLHIATYNTRTLALQDDLDHLQEKLEDFKWNVIGLCETKRKGEGLMELSDGTWIYDAGKTEKSPETKGMAFLVRKNFKDYIEGFCKHSDRVISCKVKLQEGHLLKRAGHEISLSELW